MSPFRASLDVNEDRFFEDRARDFPCNPVSVAVTTAGFHFIVLLSLYLSLLSTGECNVSCFPAPILAVVAGSKDGDRTLVSALVRLGEREWLPSTLLFFCTMTSDSAIVLAGDGKGNAEDFGE